MWIWTVFESIRCMIKLYALKFIITQIDCDINRRIDRSKRTMSQQQLHQQNEEKKRQLADLMIAQNFAILDIEYIQTRKNHKCIRKIHILAKNGFTISKRRATTILKKKLAFISER